MEDLTLEETKKLEEISSLLEGEEPATLKDTRKLESKIETLENKIDSGLSAMSEELKKKLDEELSYEVDEEKIVDRVLSKLEIPDPIKGDKGDKGDTTIVEKIIEKTEITHEIPIVTENIVEVAVTDKGEVIVDKINNLPTDEEYLKIDKKHIGGLDKMIEQDTLDRAISILDQRTSFLINKVNDVKNSIRPSASPSGSKYDVQINNGAGGFYGDDNFVYDYDNSRVMIGGPTTESMPLYIIGGGPNGGVEGKFAYYQPATARTFGFLLSGGDSGEGMVGLGTYDDNLSKTFGVYSFDANATNIFRGKVGIGLIEEDNVLRDLSFTNGAPSTIGTDGAQGLTGVTLSSEDSDEHIAITVAGVDMIKILNTGAIGIGIASPEYTLDVSHDSSPSTLGIARFNVGENDNEFQIFSPPQGSNIMLYNGGTNKLSFQEGGGITTFGTLAYIDGSGTLGLGDSSIISLVPSSVGSGDIVLSLGSQFYIDGLGNLFTTASISLSGQVGIHGQVLASDGGSPNYWTDSILYSTYTEKGLNSNLPVAYDGGGYVKGDFSGNFLRAQNADTADNLTTGSPYIKAIFDNYTDVNNGTTSETDLYSNSITAGLLAVNGDKILATYQIVCTGAALASQDMRIYFGGTLIYDTGALSIGAVTSNFTFEVTIIRESAATASTGIVRCSVAASTDFATLFPYSKYTRITGLTLGNAQVLKITGQASGAGAASNQITSKVGVVSFEGHA